jgi:hypothetical protein
MDGLIGRSGPVELQALGISGPWPFKCAVMSERRIWVYPQKTNALRFFSITAGAAALSYSVQPDLRV